MNDQTQLVQSIVPMDEILGMAGSAVSRLLLLERFSEPEGIEYSDGDFGSPRRRELIDILFERHPVTGDFRARRSLEHQGLEQLPAVHPRAAADLAERLITDLIGNEVPDSKEFLGWMVRHRDRVMIRSAVAACAAYRPLAIAPVLAFLNAMPTVLARKQLTPYATSAQRWALVVEHTLERLPFDVDSLRSLTILPEIEAAPRAVRRVSDGTSPLVVVDNYATSSALSPTTRLMTNPQLFQGITDTKDTVERLLQPWNERGLAPLSESTLALLRLVMLDRGPTQIIDTIRLDTRAGEVERSASVGIAETAAIDGIIYVYLGTLPSTISQALPIEVHTVDQERLVSGGGPVLSRYLAEMNALLTTSTDGTGVSASDWTRIARSVREPWRFVSTNRTFADLSMVDVSWTSEPVTVGRETGWWPFDGATLGVSTVDGCRQGTDDAYSVTVTVREDQVVEALELNGVPRLNTLEQPSWIRAYVQWARMPYMIVALLVLLWAIALLILGSAAVLFRVPALPIEDFYLPLSLISTLSGPLIAYISTTGQRPGRRKIKYRGQLVRGVVVTLIAATFVIAILLSAYDRFTQNVIGLGAVLFGMYLVLSLVQSLTSRVIRPRQMSRSLRSRQGETARAGNWLEIAHPSDPPS